MKTFFKFLPILAALTLCPLHATAGSHTATSASSLRTTGDAEPERAVFNVFTYKADGTRLADGYGFFISADGTGVAAYSLFKGAARAEVIDNKGHTYAVRRILGANSSYDLVKFSVEGAKKLEFLSFAASPAEAGTQLTLAVYATEKKAVATSPAKVESAADYFDYKYYDVAVPNTAKNMGCPLVNAEGQVAAIAQKNIAKDAKGACAIDARFAESLTITSLSALNADLKDILIPKALPQQEADALTYIYMLDSKDKAAMQTALADFIEAFPDNAEGYVNRGTFLADEGNMEACKADFDTALKKAEAAESTFKRDGVLHAYAKLLYDKAIQTDGTTDEALLAQALEQENEANTLNPQPFYAMQIGRILYMQKRYEEAFDTFNRVNETDFASAETYYAAAQALSMADGDSLAVLVQLDSLVSKLSKPYNTQAAQYIYMHAMQARKCGQFRKAALDLIEYEKTIGPNNLNHRFYSIRSEVERKARMYQQALDDIRTAQNRSQKPDYYLYRLEESSILLQVGLYDEAIATAQNLLAELPENPDCYRFIGIAYGEKGQKVEALKNLQKALELGDESVGALMEKYK